MKKLLQEGDFNLSLHFEFELEILGIKSKFREKRRNFMNKVDANEVDVGESTAWMVDSEVLKTGASTRLTHSRLESGKTESLSTSF